MRVPARSLNIVPPRLLETVQINCVLWLSVFCVMAPAAIFSGQVASLAEAISMCFGTATALCCSLLLYPFLVRLAGAPLCTAIPAAVAGLTAIAVLQMGGDYFGQFLVHAFFDRHRLPDHSPQALLLVTTIYWSLSACNLALLCIAGAARRLRMREVELARSQVVALSAELKQLQMQLNPHFLGNALNAVSGLILDGRYADANRMTERLADFLHAVLGTEGIDRSLTDEIAILHGYLDMEALRFGERLAISIDIEPGIEQARVPSLILQPLAENAIKHGVEQTRGAVTLRVRASRNGEDLQLEVENRTDSLVAEREGRPGHGIGLANTRARLELLFGREAGLVAEPLVDGYRATIRMPLETE